jgi:hypothetical protein
MGRADVDIHRTVGIGDEIRFARGQVGRALIGDGGTERARPLCVGAQGSRSRSELRDSPIALCIQPMAETAGTPWSKSPLIIQ